jgi:hypothetical protein
MKISKHQEITKGFLQISLYFLQYNINDPVLLSMCFRYLLMRFLSLPFPDVIILLHLFETEETNKKNPHKPKVKVHRPVLVTALKELCSVVNFSKLS